MRSGYEFNAKTWTPLLVLSRGQSYSLRLRALLQPHKPTAWGDDSAQSPGLGMGTMEETGFLCQKVHEADGGSYLITQRAFSEHLLCARQHARCLVEGSGT